MRNSEKSKTKTEIAKDFQSEKLQSKKINDFLS
jgi:hypothetical protein